MYYFASDAHFGLKLYEDPIQAQKRFVRWMDSIKATCEGLFLVGDMFDYWYEYRSVAPRGFSRFLGKLSDFHDAGIPVFIFNGNHDIWLWDYLEKECGVKVIDDVWQEELCGKRFYVTHGDGLGDPSWSFRFLRCFFRNKFCQFLYSWVHPDLTIPFGFKWANHSRKSKQGKVTESFLGEDKEFQLIWAKQHLAEHKNVDFYIFGHRHIAKMFDIESDSAKAKVAILGEWMTQFTYGVFDGEHFELKSFTD